MRYIALLALAAVVGSGQIIPGPRWYRAATGMLGVPAANANPQDILRLRQYLYFGVPGCVGLGPQQYAANLAVARNMAAYLSSVSSTATDPDARAAAISAAAAFSSFPCAYPGKQMPGMAPPPLPKPGDPPFSLRAPDLGKIPDEQQETAADLVIRYETDAARSAVTWKNAETLRISLAGRGMSLNAQTASAVGRLQPLYEAASTALHDHNWDEALSNLQAAEGTTQKVATVVGK